ncbi:MAG: hypothetical protein J6P28_05110 [Treponema sp.]|nr:hypothetical protein [Treponema sp.]
MKNEIAQVALIEEYGTNSDSGNIHIIEIHAFDKNENEISDNDFINAYNRGCMDEMFFFEDDDNRRLEIISYFANNLGISADIISEELI